MGSKEGEWGLVASRRSEAEGGSLRLAIGREHAKSLGNSRLRFRRPYSSFRNQLNLHTLITSFPENISDVCEI
jgi:hypothetical protein